MNEPLRIAVIATPYTEIPPDGDGMYLEAAE